MARKRTSPKKRTRSSKAKMENGAALGFEATLWAAADKMRGHMDAAVYRRGTSSPTHAALRG